VERQPVAFLDVSAADQFSPQAVVGIGPHAGYEYVVAEGRPASLARRPHHRFFAFRAESYAKLAPRRTGRGAEKSYCVLLTSDKQTAVAVERLGIMAKTSDGFVIAEKDLELRGPGELLGTRQSGLPEFRVANLVRDQQFIEGARKEAEFYLAKGEKSAETVKLIERVRSDARFGLAAVG